MKNFNSKATTIYDCSILHLPKIENRAGNITPLENNKNVPFAIKRVYYLYDIPSGETRGGHAHKNLYQFLVAASGSFSILIDDASNKQTISLSQPNYGLLIVPGIWRELSNFSSGAICLVLASKFYDQSDYIIDYQEFIKIKNDTPTS